jgi:hypothetical protein
MPRQLRTAVFQMVGAPPSVRIDGTERPSFWVKGALKLHSRPVGTALVMKLIEIYGN